MAQAYGIHNDPSAYEIMNNKNGKIRSPRKDKESYEETLKILQRFHFSDDEIDSLHRLLSAILHLGNFRFSYDEETLNLLNPDCNVI